MLDIFAKSPFYGAKSTFFREKNFIIRHIFPNSPQFVAKKLFLRMLDIFAKSPFYGAKSTFFREKNFIIRAICRRSAENWFQIFGSKKKSLTFGEKIIFAYIKDFRKIFNRLRKIDVFWPKKFYNSEIFFFDDFHFWRKNYFCVGWLFLQNLHFMAQNRRFFTKKIL